MAFCLVEFVTGGFIEGFAGGYINGDHGCPHIINGTTRETWILLYIRYQGQVQGKLIRFLFFIADSA